MPPVTTKAPVEVLDAAVELDKVKIPVDEIVTREASEEFVIFINGSDCEAIPFRTKGVAVVEPAVINKWGPVDE